MTYRCPRCGQVKPRTAEHFFFRRSGRRFGAVTGYCRICQRAWQKEYWAHRATPAQKARHRLDARLSWRRRRGHPWSVARVLP